uniref:Uncharacterized protein n=1 Tax=Lutzomyia longipalpis TaxID=7200 RepID=A0A1B0CT73_LUTLO
MSPLGSSGHSLDFLQTIRNENFVTFRRAVYPIEYDGGVTPEVGGVWIVDWLNCRCQLRC